MYYFYKMEKIKERKYNVEITVYTMNRDGMFRQIGSSKHSTASWRGARGHVCTILNKEYGYKTDGYFIGRKDVHIRLLP